MEPYATYELTDFLLDDAFVDWVRHPTPATDRQWQDWLRQHPDQAVVVEEARYLLQHVVVHEQLPSDADVRAAIEPIETQIAEETERVRPLGWAVAWKAAAAVVLLLGLGWYVVSNRQSGNRVAPETALVTTDEAGAVVNENRSNAPLSFRLPDGSRVRLSPKSQVRFPKKFALEIRTVELTGEAFFDVTRNPRQPFIVHTGNVNVKVLGTSFTVRAFPSDQTVNVAVKSGKVAVSKAAGKTDDPGVLLTPNQQVTFSATDAVFRRALVEAPVLVDAHTQEADFVFQETPVAEVFERLQTAYGVHIDFDRKGLQHCTVTARLSNETMYQKLNMICQAVGATHETVGTQVVIHASAPCEAD